jgi:Putative restriction endonuclease
VSTHGRTGTMAVAARHLPAGPLTWRDLWRTPDDGKRYEIIERRDRALKGRTYERCGVPHYWVVDPRRRLLEAWRLEDGRHVVEADFRGEARLRPSLFPRLAVRLGGL